MLCSKKDQATYSHLGTLSKGVLGKAWGVWMGAVDRGKSWPQVRPRARGWGKINIPHPTPGEVSAARTRRSWLCQRMEPPAGMASWGGSRYTSVHGGLREGEAWCYSALGGGAHICPSWELKRNCQEMSLFLWGTDTPVLSSGC